MFGNSSVVQLYPTSQLLEQSEIKNSNILENTVLISLDIENNSKGISKRKFVCIEFDQKLNDLVAIEYHFEEFLAAKRDGKSIYLAICVKEKEQRTIYEEAKNFLKLSVNLSNNIGGSSDKYKQDKVNEIIKHFKIGYASSFKIHKTFGELHQAYDRKTGEDVTEKLKKMLEETFFKLQKIYNEETVKYGDRASILKSILGEVETEYNQAIEDHKHLIQNTFLPLENKFKLIKDKFNKAVDQLKEEDKTEKLNNRLGMLRENVVVLGDACKGLCHENGLYTKKIIDDHGKITGSISFLLANLNKLENGSFTEGAVCGLEKKYHEFVQDLKSLKQGIEIELLFNELKLLAEKIKVDKTGKSEEKIKVSVIKEINSILQLQAKNSLEDPTGTINKVSEFIEKNKIEPGRRAGFFSKSHSVLGELIDKLQELLNRFLRALSPNYSASEVSSRTSTTRSVGR